MEIVLVRHAEPMWDRDGLNIDNPPLTERGRRQAEALADRLAEEDFDEVKVSPLVRPRETLEPLRTRKGWDEEIDPWLEEIRSPVWHGTPREKASEAFREIRSRPAEDQWRGLEGGEPVHEFVARIRQGAGLFLAERGIEPVGDRLPVWKIPEPGRKILLVAHAGTHSVVVCHLLGLDPTPWEWERFVLGHASITRLEAMELGDGYTFSLTRLSDVEHLPADERTR